MYEKLRQRKVELERELAEIAQQKEKLDEELKFIFQALKDKEKEIYNILTQMENAKLQVKQQKAEKAEADWKETAKKMNDLKEVLLSKSFYKSIRKHMPEPHWKKLTKVINSDELFNFILKNHYANRVIKVYKNNEELNVAIMEAIVSKLKTLL